MEQLSLFEELRKWRKDKYISEGFYHAYMVFTDKELINIITADVKNRRDLIKVRGIGEIKYGKYSEELFNIIETGKYDSIKKIYNNKVDMFDNSIPLNDITISF